MSYYNRIRPISTLQKYVIRIICKKSRLHHCGTLFMESNILPIRHLYCYKVSKTFFIRSGYLNNRVSYLYQLRINNYNLAAIPSFRTTAFRNFYYIFACRLFNILPFEIRIIKSINIFLKKVKQWLLGDSSTDVENFFNVLA